MHKEFTTEYIKNHCGCYAYKPDKLKDIYLNNNKKESFDSSQSTVTLDEILHSTIPVIDKYWFVCKKVFTRDQSQQIAIIVTEAVLPIYEANHPDSKEPRETIEAIKLYLKKEISLEELQVKWKGTTQLKLLPGLKGDASCVNAVNYAANAATVKFTYYAKDDAYHAIDYASHVFETGYQLQDILLNFVITHQNESL